jgi:hypothetical protein
MTPARHWHLLLAGTALLATTGAWVSYHRTRTDCCPGLPCYDYQHDGFGGSKSVQSQIAVLIEQRLEVNPAAPPAGKTSLPPRVLRDRIKYYQLPQSKMQIDHCSLSRVALTLHENGYWTLSLGADQNPWMTGQRQEASSPTQTRGTVNSVRAPIPPLTKQTNDLKRNLFRVKIRCYGGYPLQENRPELSGGKPVLFELEPDPFWVQRGIPYDYWKSGATVAAQRFFDVIDRVEVEFSYR